jgi:hypothetical protein
MLIMVILWVVSVNIAARAWGREPASGVLASIFALNHIVYWGFYSFAVGWPVFLLWMSLLRRDDQKALTARLALKYLGCVILLYMGHILWLAAGLAWFALRSAAFRAPVMPTLKRAALMLPLVIGTIAWYQMFSASSMATPPLWVTPILSRLWVDGLTMASLGGIKGYTEPLAMLAALIWIVGGLIRWGRDPDANVDKEILLAAGMFFVAVLILPDKFMNTIQFWQRWGPPAATLMILAVPAPLKQALLRQAMACVVLALFVFQVALAWLEFETKELSGLKRSLSELPQGQRTLGLNMLGKSNIVHGQPFIQIFAYAQVLKGGELSFSFAQFSPCLVVYKKPFVPPWTGGLEWFPNRVKRRDLLYFDYVIVGGGPRVHNMTGATPELEAVTDSGVWRLYRVKAGQGAMSLE